MEQIETAQRLAGCSFGVSGVPFWGKLRASMEQMETTQRLAGCSFDVSGVPLWGKLRASMEQMGNLRMESAFQWPNRGRDARFGGGRQGRRGALDRASCPGLEPRKVLANRPHQTRKK